MAHEEAKEADGDLHGRDLPGEPVLAQGAAPDEPEVQDGEVGRLEDLARVLVVLDDAQEPQLAQEADDGGDGGPGLLVEVGLPARHRGLEQAGARVEVRQAVARARDQAEELGHRVAEVEDLRDHEEQEGLGEVAENGYDDEDHACKVAVRIAYEDAGRVLVVQEQGAGDTEERQQEVEREQVGVGGRVRVGRDQVQGIVEDEEQRNHNGLEHFNSVDARQDVDAVGTEDAESGHVSVVEETEIEKLATDIGLQDGWEDDGSDAKVDKIDDEKRNRGERWNKELVSPSNIEEVVADAEDGYGLEGNDRRQERGQLHGGRVSIGSHSGGQVLITPGKRAQASRSGRGKAGSSSLPCYEGTCAAIGPGAHARH